MISRWAVALASSCAVASGAMASDFDEVDISVQILPIASLEILGGGTLELTMPPAGSTIPSDGVDFKVVGNSNATVTAEPDSFLLVGGQHRGRASLSGQDLGYALEVRFPAAGAPGSPVQISALPGFEAGPTTPPLTVDLTQTGMARIGTLHLESDPYWTPSGGLPLPGVYVADITLTLSVD